VSCAGRRPSCQDALEIRNERRRRIFWRIKELAWQEGLGTVNGVSWGEVGLVSPGCTYTQEDPWQMLHPVRSGCPSPEGVLESPMKPFNDPIRLRVVGRGGRPGDVQEGAEGRPH